MATAIKNKPDLENFKIKKKELPRWVEPTLDLAVLLR
jgi:hypothetical protein